MNVYVGMCVCTCMYALLYLAHFHDRGMLVGGAGALWVEPGPDSKAVEDPHRVYTPDLRHGVQHRTCGETQSLNGMVVHFEGGFETSKQCLLSENLSVR